MEKRKVISIILAINSIIFFWMNAETDLINPTLWRTLWGWSIWLYLLVCLITSLNDIGCYRYEFKQYMIVVLNFISQFCICALFMFSYCHQILELNVFQKRVVAIIIVGAEMCTRMAIKSDKDRYYIAEESINEIEMKQYVQAKLLKHESHLDKNLEQRVQIVLENVITLLLLAGTSLILRMVMDITFENAMIFPTAKKYVLFFFIFFMVLFVILNYRKYTYAGYHKMRFVIDSLLGIVAMAIWVFDSSHSTSFGMLLFMGYLLIPFLFAFYDIINVYQFGKRAVKQI